MQGLRGAGQASRPRSIIGHRTRRSGTADGSPDGGVKIALSRCIALVLATNALVAGVAWALHVSCAAQPHEQAVLADPFLRPGGSVLGRFGHGRGCRAATYAGPETPLYADRPYHTSERVAALEGLHFCRGNRHGRDLWILDVSRATALYTIASSQHGLERAGWRLFPEPVLVEAAGLALDRVYQLRVEPGRYAIHYGHATTANPVFWDPRDARIVSVPPADG